MRVFMRQAKGRYVLIVHQDAIPLESVTELLRLVDLVEQHDPDWGDDRKLRTSIRRRHGLSAEIPNVIFRSEICLVAIELH
jgi:hypothetical protein